MTSSIPQAVMLAPLAGMLATATIEDVRSRRIPNVLVALGLIAGLALSALPGGAGLLNASAGIAIGAAAFMPLYLMGGMGAGDVKLMAAVGAFVGGPAALVAAIYALAAGGALSLAAAFAVKQQRVPFAAAIAAGTAAQIFFAGRA